MFLKLVFEYLLFLIEKVTDGEMCVATYYFDVLRLMLEYILEENYFRSVIWFLLECFGC